MLKFIGGRKKMLVSLKFRLILRVGYEFFFLGLVQIGFHLLLCNEKNMATLQV